MSVPHSPTDEKEKQGKPDWQGQLSEDEDLPLDDERLEQLREEQGVRGIPEVDVPPEFESDEDLPVPTENLGNSNMFEQTGSSFQSRSETRQNRNLATGSASSERLSAVDAIEHADLDDFEEEERRVQKELESSGEHEFRGSLQNRQEVFSEAVRENVEDEYDSDYPEGWCPFKGFLGHQVQYPKEPPPAYSSPPKSPSRVEPIQEENDDYYDSEDEERGEEAKNFFGENTTGVSALAAGGLALVGGVHKISQENTDLDPEGEEGRSSQESYRFNDAIRDQSPVDRGGQLPPIEPAKSPESQPKREESTPEAAYAMTNDLKNLLQVVEQYHAVNIEVEPYLVPFDVNYVPAVGDVHPGIGIPRPDGVEDYLGLVVLDEPSSKQSNSTVINMLLKDKKAPDEPVKKLFRPDKNTKAIEQWIENIKEVRRTNPPDRLAYSRPMPDIEKLMEEWNPEFDSILRGSKLPTAAIDATTEEFADLVLAYADIPVHASRIQSLHLLFSLYNEFKNSQHFRNAAYGTGANTETDRLEL
ncbi:hypothetical protein FO519_000851 [Halicephalobus sp. NKZ332]|nr:hypothetical protein FO519_000851 [Halicephalobus sp. NKZ332]